LKHLRKLGLVVLVNTTGALIPALIAFLHRPHAGLSYFLNEFQFGCVYAYIIGTLAFLVMDYVGPRCGKLPKRYGYPLIYLTFTALALVGTLAANGVFVALGWITPAEFWPGFRFGISLSLAITLLLGTLVVVVEVLQHRLRAATEELQARQLEEERARKLATEARLSSLESRIHPHFLFNTLNSITSLIREDPARAERTVERLAALLRYSLDAAARPLVPLRQELRIVQDYLDIEKTRFGDRLRYSLDIAPEAAGLEVPPMALQTLVENSIKHAVSISRQGGEICVSARLEADRLVLEVADDGPGFDGPAVLPGHGLANLQERLEALFDGAGGLEIIRRDGHMVVSVALPRKHVLV